MTNPSTSESKAVKLAIVYYSTYGTNHAMANEAADAARAAGAEVRLVKVQETAPQAVIDTQDAWKAQQERTADVAVASPNDLEWANAILFSAPTRFGGAASQIRAFIDTLGGLWGTGKLADKTFSAMTSAQNPNGGQETTLQTLYITAMHWGAILVPPGYTDPVIFASGGNPYGASVTANGEPLSDADKATIRHQAKRLVEVTAKLQ
ncbi:NAD(P)H:quinone oxidoreductase, type IV [Deinococcus radiopugnans]|uniref:NAD(P)H:quinone oxidoreductase, type IV n=1 Tax=Deinococcus radiopugnans TaxID=57497 RepID=A0A0A7KGA9_9DEIO|nr:NAD(P)H:quinone oxidoreductase [Deinococcus radiopugnans]AIZ45207.1 NAD(P)H:quinone oxidoreductase, type IV [Deinococcus radiopugnans]